LALIALAALPWFLPLLKSLELPGGIKIELRDVKAATEKITSDVITGKGELKADPAAVSGRGDVRFTDPIGTLRHVADRDPTLAVVGFRIEIEKRLLRIAEANQIDARRMPLSILVGELRTQEVLPPNVASGLTDLIALGNRAAHGVEVTPDAANWVLDVGPSILSDLDASIKRGNT